jgi:tight adherence protein C
MSNVSSFSTTLALGLLAALAAFFLAIYLVGLGKLLAPARETDRPAEAARPSVLALWRAHLLSQLSAKVAPHLPTVFITDLTRQIVQAGGLAGLTPAQLVVYGAGAAICGLAFGLLLIATTGWSPLLVLGATLVGAVMPFVWLRDQVKRRHLEILLDLPYHLDLLTLCVEAGLDFSAGVMKMVDKGKPGALHDEFSRFLTELRVGKTRAEALEAMSERVNLTQLSNFLAALIQAERLGTGLARTLRVQAEQLRVERSQRAEAKAGEAPVKMLLPLVLFVFPTIWIVLAAPLVFEWLFAGTP